MKFNIRTQPGDIPDRPTQEELEDLGKLLLAHCHLYYSGGDAVLTDYEYDKLENRLKKVAPDLPVLQLVGTYSEDPEIIALAGKMKRGEL